MRLAALWLLFSISCAAASESFVVRDLDISGLRRTRRWVVERELHFAVGDTVTADDLQSARRRIQNLSLFSDVQVNADSTGRVIVEFSELWPVFPVIFLEFSEGQLSDVIREPDTFFDKATLFLGGIHINAGGNGWQVYSVAQLGASNGFEVGFNTRWLARRLPVFCSLELENERTSDRHSAIGDSTRSLRSARYEFEIATRAGAPSRLGMLLKYQGIRQEKDWPAEGKHFRTVWFSPYAVIDRRDLEWYPSRGALAGVRADIVTGSTFFVRSTYDLRGYIPLSEGSRPPLAAVRLSAATSTNRTPSWAHFYHGFNSGLRGYVNEKSESSGYLIGSAELRFPITRETTYNLPLLGRYGKRLPWGVNGMLAVERGELILDGERRERLGYAAGFYVRIPYFEILEISAAADRDGHLEYLVNTGVHF
jgi:outer membrane protein assembly factor BamA